MYREIHHITASKPAQRSLRDKPIQGNMAAMIASVNTKSLSIRGWTLTPEAQADTAEGHAYRRIVALDNEDYEYIYEMYFTLTFYREDEKKPETHELASIVRTLASRSLQPSFGSWSVTMLDGKPYIMPDSDSDVGTVTDLIGYADVNLPEQDEWEEGFAHLFGLEPHIARVRAALEAGMDSQWSNRFHCALVGPPGCGKSDIGESLRRLLGEDAVMKLDATATTAAGAIKELSEREILPRVIVIEEIEKAPEAAMSFLLGVLDQRSEIRKTTARGTIQRDTKLLAIATVNDVALFRKLQAGALSSRFPNLVFFKRPGREVLAQILTREVGKVNGKYEWIAPTLNYCQDHDITDPRKVISLCLCGRDAWLDGTYAHMLDATGEPEAD